MQFYRSCRWTSLHQLLADSFASSALADTYFSAEIRGGSAGQMNGANMRALPSYSFELIGRAVSVNFDPRTSTRDQR